MKRKLFVTIAALTLFLGGVIGVFAASQTTWQGQRWEYAVLGHNSDTRGAAVIVADPEQSITITEALQAIAEGLRSTDYAAGEYLEYMGNEGWELVSVARELDGRTLYYFKRPI